MSQTVLVTGATGLLGRQIFKAFDDAGWKTTGTGFSRAAPHIRKLDLQEEEQVVKLLDEVKYVFLANCWIHIEESFVFTDNSY